MSPTANTNDQLPGERLVLAPPRQVAGPEDPRRLHALVRQLPPDRRLPLPARQDRGASGAASLTRMMTNLPPYFQETRDLLIQNVIDTYGPNATYPDAAGPAAAVGRGAERASSTSTSSATRPAAPAATTSSSAPTTASTPTRACAGSTRARASAASTRSPAARTRSSARPDGNMWITQAGSDSLAEVYVDGVTPPRYFPLPRIGDDQGAYPHTLRFDSQGQIWMTLTKSNHLAALRSADGATWTYHRLPEADPAEVGLSIPVAYGCDVAPDDTRLVVAALRRAHRTLRSRPPTRMKAWRPPFYGPRRLARGSGRHRLGAGLRLGRARPLRSRRSSAGRSIRCPPGFPGRRASAPPRRRTTSTRTARPARCGSTAPTPTRLIRFEPEERALHRLPAPDARELHARDRVRSRQQRLDLHVERAAGTGRARDAASS